MYAPGWGPLVAFTSPWLRLYLVPFEVLGYASLAYLVYANVLDLTRSTFSGALGLVTCVGCTVPVLTPLVGVLGGPAAGPHDHGVRVVVRYRDDNLPAHGRVALVEPSEESFMSHVSSPGVGCVDSTSL